MVRTFRCNRSRRGVALIYVVITFGLLLGLTGLVIDTARVLLVGHELQNAADAGALAGAEWVRTSTTTAMADARTIAAANTAEKVSVTIADNPSNSAGGKVLIGTYDRTKKTFTATLSGANAVKVITERSAGQNGTLPLLFGPIYGVSASTVQRQAIAMVGGGTGAGLIALNASKRGALHMAGNPTLTVNGGAVLVDSTDTQAIQTVGNKDRLLATEVDVVGNASFGSSSTFTGTLNTGVSSVADPLSGLAAPSTSGMPTLSYSKNTTATLSPGYYPNGITNDKSGATLTLQPGIYVLDGNGLEINGGNVNANGVMFYIKGTGSVNIGGNGNVNITPIDDTKYTYPAGTSIYDGMSIYQDNTVVSSMQGTSASSVLQGTLYFKHNEIDLGGNTNFQAGNQLIADSVSISGTATMTIIYDGRNPAAGNLVFLVQ